MSVTLGAPAPNRPIVRAIADAAVAPSRQSSVEGDFQGVHMVSHVDTTTGNISVTVGEGGPDQWCLRLSIDAPGTDHAGQTATVQWVRANCSIQAEHKGTLMLQLVDALATHFCLGAVSLHDDAKLRDGVGLTWLRAMIKGEGWYESHGYIAATETRRHLWREAVHALRTKDVAAMRDECVRALVSESSSTACTAFVSNANAYLAGEHAAPDFGSFVGWLAKTDFRALAVVYNGLFKSTSFLSAEEVHDITDEPSKWRAVEGVRPRRLTKTFADTPQGVCPYIRGFLH
jgi:hypothetical protein